MRPSSNFGHNCGMQFLLTSQPKYAQNLVYFSVLLICLIISPPSSSSFYSFFFFLFLLLLLLIPLPLDISQYLGIIHYFQVRKCYYGFAFETELLGRLGGSTG